VPWSTQIEDPITGSLRLRGRLSTAASADGSRCLLIVHGLGGDSSSHYVIDTAVAAERAGLAHLRLDLRGADGSGQDFYNAAITADLRAALASPELAGYRDLFIVGYSLGGHITLRYATEAGVDPRVRAIASVCAPLDLDRCAAAIDQPARWVYRRHVLAGLKQMYAAYAAHRHGNLGVSASAASGIRHLRDWDEQIVAPRFGFSGASAYYAASSVGPRLGELRVPALMVIAEADPMVPAETLRPWLAAPHPKLDLRWIDPAGHVGFPASLDLGFPAPLGLEGQVLQWLRAQA
jgi:predicted alpha/beta-fold hydrolase